MPSIQPNPSDLTNALLLQILQHSDSFVAPITDISPNLVIAQSILFASLAVTLLAAFITVLIKRWILYYGQPSVQEGDIVKRGEERQLKFDILHKWGPGFILELPPVLLQIALLLFDAGLVLYLWDLNPSAASVVLGITLIGLLFYGLITVVGIIRRDWPFQTHASNIFSAVLSLLMLVFGWVWRRFTGFLIRSNPKEEVWGSVIERFFSWFPDGEDPDSLSNPAFWRSDPLFVPPLTKDTAATAGFWLLENSTDFTSAAAVAAASLEFQWPSNRHSATALLRFRNTYAQCFRAPVPNRSARLQALQSAAAYYVLYHAWLLRSASKGRWINVEGPPPDIPPDLFHLHSEKWGRQDLFVYLLSTEDRSEPVESAQFLSYIAPYWFRRDSNSLVETRPTRLKTLKTLIAVLERDRALVPATLTDCVLCVGAVMDFPLHPDDLIRVDKRYVLLLGALRGVLIGGSDYLAPTFKLVVEHVLGTALARSRLFRHVPEALKILLTLVELTTLPLVNAAWIYELLKRAANNDIADEEFTLLLKLSAWRKEEDTAVNTGLGDPPVQHFEANPLSLETTATSEAPTSDDTLFRKVMEAIQTCGWQDEIVYGGLLAIRDVRKLGPSLFDDEILQTFHEATDDSKPLRVRQAAYDAVLVTQAQWLTSENLRQKLQDPGFFDHLHKVVVGIARSDYQRSFLTMMEVLSEDVNWHPYLREHMDLWVPFRYEGGPQILHIIGKVGGLTFATPGDRGSSSIDEVLQKLVVEEWAAVPGRPVGDLTADRLRQLADVTGGFKELAFSDSCRKAVLATVEQVLPGLDLRREGGYAGPGDDVQDIINDLLKILRVPKRQFTFD